MMERRRKRNQRNAAIFVGIGCLGLAGITLVLAVLSGIMNLAEASTVRGSYGEAYASACQPVPAGATSIANAPAAAAPRQFLLLATNTERRHAWHSQLPEPWQASKADEVVFIGCIEEREVLLETCEYVRGFDDPDGGFSVRVRRQQQQATIVILDAVTSRRVDSLTLSGPAPAPCPLDDEDEVTSSRDEIGDDVTLADFSPWLENYVFAR